jgi:hypothetical protein
VYGARVHILCVRAWHLGFEVWELGLMVDGFGFRVRSVGVMV